MATHFHVTDFPTDYSPGERLENLLFKALEIGASRFRAGEQLVPMLIVQSQGEYDLVAFVDIPQEDARRSASAELKRRGATFDAYVLLYGATLTGSDFAGEIKAVAAEGADRGSTHGFRLFGIPDVDRINPLYHGHSEQLSV